MKSALKILITVLIFSFMVGCWTTSEGTRSGIITKLSEKGVIIKTWEGQMILGGPGASGNTENTWNFSVESEAVYDALKLALESEQQVKVEYREEMVVMCWRGETNYMITNVLQ